MSDSLRVTLSMMPYGIYILTTHHEDDDNAMVANWITQVSFTPRLISAGIQTTSYSYGLIEASRVFTINMFRKDDGDKLRPFYRSRKSHPEKMQEATYTAAPKTGCPIVEGAAAYIEVEVKDIIDVGGDHNLVIGTPINGTVVKRPRLDGAQDIYTLVDANMNYSG